MGDGILATIKDVAKEAGVSISTASIALSGKGPVSSKTRQQVLEAAKKLNYLPNAVARSLVTRRTRSIGLILADITDPYFHEVTKGVESVLSAHGYSLTLTNTDRSYEKERRSIETFRSQQVEGIILAGSTMTSDAHLDDLMEENIPVVAVGQREVNTPLVTVDNFQAGAMLARHLIEHGYRRFAFIQGPKGLKSADERFEGFERELAASGFAIKPECVVAGNFTLEGGYDAALKLLEIETPDAIVAANDQTAIGALKAVKRFGLRIPQDVAVAGVGDIPTARFTDPPLTTVKLPLRTMGEEAARLLLRLIDGESIPSDRISLPIELKLRDSTLR